MLKTSVFSLSLLFFLLFIFESHAFAQIKLALPSAALVVTIQNPDIRVRKLQAYLEKYNSPLAPYASVFVSEADRYNLDWKLLVAISGVESTFGKRYPQGSYNAWGWGIYGTNRFSFPSWEIAIQTISRELRMRYMDKWQAETVWQIGRYYASSPTWASRVVYFMKQIEAFEDKTTNLSISL
jgi:hypothetical protein